MVVVEFTSLLKRFFPNLQSEKVDASDVKQLLVSLDQKYPGLSGYLIDEQGSLRKHVNIFVNGKTIEDRIKLSDKLFNQDKVNIIQALSGG